MFDLLSRCYLDIVNAYHHYLVMNGSFECRYKYQKAVPEAMKAGSLRVNGTLPVVRTEVYKINFDDDRCVSMDCCCPSSRIYFSETAKYECLKY